MDRPKMSREERAKQFMPFAALKGHTEALRKKEKIRVEKQELSEEYKEISTCPKCIKRQVLILYLIC